MTKSTITRERLQEIAEDGFLKHGESKELARIALAAMDSEPVAWIVHARTGDQLTTDGGYVANAEGILGLHSTPLYRHAQPVRVVPDSLIAAVNRLLDSDGSRGCYSAIQCGDAHDEIERMLAAAPQLPGSEPATVPGKWIPVSERMPEDDDFVYIWPRPDFGVELHVGQYCECSPKGDGWYAQVYEQNYGIEWHPITVTHWMPLPAGPKEVKGE